MSLAKRPKVNLPKDWIVVNSTSFPDRIYYFNVRTGKSSWKEPRHETNKSNAVGMAQKRKLSAVDKDDDVPAEKIPSTSGITPSEPKERKLLRAKRCPSPAKALETPQMREMRQKILNKKRPKPEQNHKIKSDVDNGDKAASVSSKSSRVARAPQRRGSKKSGEASCSVSQSSTSTSCRGPSTTATTARSAASKGTRAQSDQKSVASTSSTAPRNTTLKKNLANKRLDSLKKKLNVERKKIEPAIVRSMLSQIPPDVENGAQTPKSPTRPLVPEFYGNTGTRNKSVSGKWSPPKTVTRENEEPVAKICEKLPKIPKTKKKNAKAAVVEENVVEPVVEDRCRDSFWEEMDWEPIEEEKVVVEIQEVRMQLSTDQGTTPQRLPDHSINGLELSQASQNTDKQTLYVVVDTNVFLSNLKTVTELLEDSGRTKSPYKPVVVVPWTVLQELDYIKDNKSKKKSVQLQNSAKAAVDLLFRYFGRKHPRLKGQTAIEAAANRTKFRVESPDDEILQSCLQIREFGCAVALLSNDKNLCNKAIIHEISTYGRHESIQDMLLLNRRDEPKRLVKDPVIDDAIVKRNLEIVDSIEAEVSDEIFGEAKAIVKNFLSTIVSKEMEKLYGVGWKKYTIVRPPWSVMDVLKCADKHWVAAVSDAFANQTQHLIGKLSEMFANAPKYGQSLRLVGETLDVCYDLVMAVKSEEYQDLLDQSKHDIEALMATCKAKLKELERNRSGDFIHENNNITEEERANNAFKYFEQIWRHTNDICGLAADQSGIPHTIIYKSIEPPIPADVIRSIQPVLITNLDRLILALRTVLNEDGYMTADHPALQALYQCLVTYLPDSGELNDTRSLDLADLLCCITVKKDFLRTGLVQLQELSCQFARIADFRSLVNIS